MKEVKAEVNEIKEAVQAGNSKGILLKPRKSVSFWGPNLTRVSLLIHLDFFVGVGGGGLGVSAKRWLWLSLDISYKS